MRRLNILLIAVVLSLSGKTAQAQGPAAFRVLFGINDNASTRWDGTVTVENAGQYNLEPWRFYDDDNIQGNSFHFSTRQGLFFRPIKTPDSDLPLANGFILSATAVGDSSEFAFTTAQGKFGFRAADVPYGKGMYQLGGRVYVDRTPVTTRLTDTPEEEDYPALAMAKNGDVWLAYVQFHHSRDADKIRVNPPTFPKDFSLYSEPTGGDQIWAQKYSGGKWGESIPVTPAGKDCFKTTVAVDGNGQTWVIWSENDRGNFDIFARSVSDSGAGRQLRISSQPGADVDPVATTDSSGHIWIAWQGWRNGVAAIFSSHQEGSGFSQPAKISGSDKDEWDPAIAADHTGRVTVAWDSYRNGNFDIYARTFAASAWGGEFPVAATDLYEAYPSMAYDGTGRLWIAYEEGARNWGKDWGAYDTSGVSVYQGRLVKLVGIEPDGSFVDTNPEPDSVLIGVPSTRVDRPGIQMDSITVSLALNKDYPLLRPPNVGPNRFRDVVRNSLPRLAVDGSDRIWLAFRTPHPEWFNPVLGTVWHEYVTSFDGKAWTPPIFLDHSDNLLDNQPALAATANGRLLVVNSSDGRRDTSPAKATFPTNSNFSMTVDPYNNDLWSQEIELKPGTQSINVMPARDTGAPASTWDSVRVAALQAIHAYRGGPEKNLRIVRGEFHRHSEISTDGHDDGTLYDQYRYILDAVALDWVGCCDHDNGADREYPWWITQKMADVFYSPGHFSPMFSYERSVSYPDGHRNVIFAQRGIHVLPRFDPAHLANADEQKRYEHTRDTQMLYAYLKQFGGVVGSHTSATGMGTDWRDNDPNSEPVVEIYQGDRQSYEMPGSPRSSSATDSIGGYRPKGYVNIALDKGYRLGFEASSDHVSTHISYADLYVKDVTRESVVEALKARHAYAATDEILADVECGTHMMGDEFTTAEPPTLRVKLRGTGNIAKVAIIRDGKTVYATTPNSPAVDFAWRDNQPNKGTTSYYYVRGEQADGNLVWVSPMWIKYTGN